METIRLSGYITAEKLQIARNHLWPKLLERSGLERDRIQLDDEALQQIIEGYAREAGVRSLEKQLGRIVRKSAVQIVENHQEGTITVERIDLDHYLGKPPFKVDTLMAGVGVVTGLAWTAMGGATLNVEASLIHTKNRQPDPHQESRFQINRPVGRSHAGVGQYRLQLCECSFGRISG